MKWGLTVFQRRSPSRADKLTRFDERVKQNIFEPSATLPVLRTANLKDADLVFVLIRKWHWGLLRDFPRETSCDQLGESLVAAEIRML